MKILYMNFRKYLCLFLFLLASSCVSKKDIHYFQNMDKVDTENNFKFLEIQPGDILDIQIKALNPESVLVFQRQSIISPQGQQLENRTIDGYLVGEDGSISIPLVGDIMTTNLNTNILAQKIEKVLGSYIKNPSVNIRILNFRVSVLGEVKNPGTFKILEERISLPQAIGLAGDLTINGDRNKILIIRNEKGKNTNFEIDLTKSDIFESPVYFLKQNDIVYVKPNNALVKSSGLIGNTATLVSILSIALNLFIVIK